MYKKCFVAWSIVFVFVFLGCASQKTVSEINNYPSEEHKSIYEYLQESKESFNQRLSFDASNYTKNAKVMTQYNDEKITVSPEKLEKIWPEKIKTYKKHEFKIRSIRVKNISIQDDTAKLKTKRTYYSSRWNKFYNYSIEKVLKNVDGEWKIHRLTYQEI